MRVIYVSTEVYPALKTGGLADVNAALPGALIKAGADVRLLLPAFPDIASAAVDLRTVLRLYVKAFGVEIRILRGLLAGVPAYLIDAGRLYDRPGNPYVDAQGRDWPDNQVRFALLGWVAALFSGGSIDDWRPDIVHAHDWHTGLAPAYLVARGGERPGSVFTVHNLEYQGEFPGESFPALALPAAFFSIDGIEFYGKVNFMKAGLQYADQITTVSPTYASEIMTPEFGCGMDGLLRAREGALSGVLNGVDRTVWNPSTDQLIAARYDAQDLAGKATCKASLRNEFGLAASDGPLFGVVSRLTRQKGLDLLFDLVPDLVGHGSQLVLLGSGDQLLESSFREMAARFPRDVGVSSRYDERLAHRVMAGSDVILVPSRFEPCGLTQMYAMAYGSLPLVRRVGGLADTVCDASAENLVADIATGIVFDEASASALRDSFERALELWNDPVRRARVMRAGMRKDFGWMHAARSYLDLYRRIRPLA